jgi:hypothetical protein
MNVNFSKEQFLNLLKIVYLGNWMANAIHNNSKEDPHNKDFEEIENYIYSFAKEFGFEKYFEYDPKLKRYFPTNEFDVLVQEYIDEYDDHAFWDELFYRMSDRDFNRAYSNKKISEMEQLERFEKEEPFRNKWDKEINEHGIERLDIIENASRNSK